MCFSYEKDRYQSPETPKWSVAIVSVLNYTSVSQ